MVVMKAQLLWAVVDSTGLAQVMGSLRIPSVQGLVELRGSTRPHWVVPLDGTFRVAA